VPGDGDTIVVIEDDHNIADLVGLCLRREGYRVLQAGELDGLDVCRRVRAHGDVLVAGKGRSCHR
jgi:DNA-binding response OmpR family regulator